MSNPYTYTREIGVTELVGKDEEVNTDDYGASVVVSFDREQSGEFIQFTFYATEEGGAVQDSAGTLFIFDADPAISAGDTSITAAEAKTVIGKVEVVADDWETDANGGVACITDRPIRFHRLSNLYFAWKHTDATDLNDAAGDDEVLEVNAWLWCDSD